MIRICILSGLRSIIHVYLYFMFKVKLCIIIIYGFMTYQKSIIMPFLVYHKSINNDYSELFLKHKLKIDMYYSPEA